MSVELPGTFRIHLSTSAACKLIELASSQTIRSELGTDSASTSLCLFDCNVFVIRYISCRTDDRSDRHLSAGTLAKWLGNVGKRHRSAPATGRSLCQQLKTIAPGLSN